MSKIKIGMAGRNERLGLYPNWCRSPVDKVRFYAQSAELNAVAERLAPKGVRSGSGAWPRYSSKSARTTPAGWTYTSYL